MLNVVKFVLRICMAALIGLAPLGLESTANAQDAAAQSDLDPNEEALRRQAELAREAAELRIEADMAKMTNLAEALSKTLGQMHFLRTLCFGDTDQVWRDQMAELLRYEAPRNSITRANLTRAFNTGFYQEQRRHSECSQDVSVDVAALAENGRSLAEMLGDPYRAVPGEERERSRNRD